MSRRVILKKRAGGGPGLARVAVRIKHRARREARGPRPPRRWPEVRLGAEVRTCRARVLGVHAVAHGESLDARRCVVDVGEEMRVILEKEVDHIPGLRRHFVEELFRNLFSPPFAETAHVCRSSKPHSWPR